MSSTVVPNPVSPTPTGGLMATIPRQTFKEHRRAVASCVGELAREVYNYLLETDREDDHTPRSGRPLPDGSLEVREREILFVCFSS